MIVGISIIIVSYVKVFSSFKNSQRTFLVFRDNSIRLRTSCLRRNKNPGLPDPGADTDNFRDNKLGHSDDRNSNGDNSANNPRNYFQKTFIAMARRKSWGSARINGDGFIIRSGEHGLQRICTRFYFRIDIELAFYNVKINPVMCLIARNR